VKLTWERDNSVLRYGNRAIRVECNVRNELNGRRELYEPVVYSELEDGSKGKPYMPRPFPKGVWTVTGILPKTIPYEAPEFISTDARQIVNVWSVVDAHYGAETKDAIEDYGYGLHNSTSNTTLGCGKIIGSQDRADLVEAIRIAWTAGDVVTLEVV
jgi:hypothetical protein